MARELRDSSRLRAKPIAMLLARSAFLPRRTMVTAVDGDQTADDIRRLPGAKEYRERRHFSRRPRPADRNQVVDHLHDTLLCHALVFGNMFEIVMHPLGADPAGAERDEPSPALLLHMGKGFAREENHAQRQIAKTKRRRP